MAFTYQEHSTNNIIEYKPSGNLLERESATEMITSFDKHLNAGNNYFIFNLEKVEYLNSTGLNILIGLLTKVRNSGGELIICNVSSKINQLLLITKLNTIFNVAMSTKEANKIIEKERSANVSEN